MEVDRRLRGHLQAIYSSCLDDQAVEGWTSRLLDAMALNPATPIPPAHRNLWTERDIALIAYGDSVQSEAATPLATLHRFLGDKLRDVISWVHILPFHPWTSDDGFAVLDYSSINEALGDWSDISAIGGDYRLMADLVLNHCSSRSAWFENFKRGIAPGAGYFFVPSDDFDVSAVVRPRTSPLLTTVTTQQGEQSVWCTFSPDQVDFDFRNPAVLEEFARIIRQFLDAGVRIFRLDAVAFLWKASGTGCISLPQTHELIRLFRTLIECAQADAIVITETNVPNTENLSYFGNANEAHAIYNFSLPPLLVHGLVAGTSRYLREWMMRMPPAQDGTTYFNFIASHDGIGLRPVEGLLSEDELATLIGTLQDFGGLISSRRVDGDKVKPYEVNIALFDALQGTTAGADSLGVQRYLCAHAIMLGLEGVPAFYLNALVGTRNDVERVEHSGHNRAINRHQWSFDDLMGRLGDGDSDHCRVFEGLKYLIALRREQPAFHPNATQFTLQLEDQLLGFWRQSADRRQSIFCVHNLAPVPRELVIASLNLIVTDYWYDLISNTRIEPEASIMELQPYQTVWISNRR